MRRYYYLLTLTFVFCIPTIIAAVLLQDVIALRELVPFVVLVTIIGSIWDVWATRHGKRDRVWLWQFHQSQTLGHRFLGLPIEEYLFYTASSIYIIYMWEGLKVMAGGDHTCLHRNFRAGTVDASCNRISVFLPQERRQIYQLT